MTAHDFWNQHPRLHNNVFLFAEEYADWVVEQREEMWMERAENWFREKQKLEAKYDERICQKAEMA